MDIWSSLLDRLAFPLVAKLATGYVERNLLTPRRRFKKRDRDLTAPERRALEMVKSVGVRPASTRSVTEDALDEITGSIAEFLRHAPDGSTRRFGINFLSYYTDEMTIGGLMVALRRLDPRSLAAIVSAVIAELQQDTAVRLISVRDALGKVLQSTEDMCRAELEGNNLLQKYLEHRDDLGKYEGRDGNDLQLDYAGVDVPLAPGSDTFEEMRRAQEEMKRVGRLTARQKCSRTHIVMSVAIGSEWEGCAGVDEQRFAVMTAEKTDKTNLLIPSQTPVVSKRGSTWLFYGDPSTRPTSELVSHWTIHQKLCASSSAWRRRRAIFHAHMIELIELSRRHLEQTIAPVGGKAVPNLDWTNHGTIRLGEQIAAGMLERDSQIAIVKHHGPWFVSESLEQGLDMALDAVHKVRQSDTRPV